MLNILIVDKDPILREQVAKLASESPFLPCQFHVCSSAEEAMYFMEWHPRTAVALVDLMLRGTDAASLLFHLRKKNRHIQAIAVSVFPDVAGIREAMNFGALEFLSKPISLEELSASLLKAIRQAETLRNAEESNAQIQTMKKDLDIAAQIQRAILPEKFPSHPLFDLYARTQPAREVGGDFYDFYPISENRIGFVLGDASGKGVPAAIFMAACQAFMRSLVGYFPEPGDLLQALNRQLCLMNQSDQFVTLFYGVFDIEAQRLDFAIGGHPPPIIVRQDGRIQPLSQARRGTLVGVFPGENYVTQSIPFSPGDCLVAFTDGVLGASAGKKEELLEEEFQYYLRILAGCSCKDMIDYLFKILISPACPVNLLDDRTVLALRSTHKKKPDLIPTANSAWTRSLT